MTHDSAAKTYVLNLGEALHHELAPAGVDVTVVMPGSVDTPIIDALGLRRAALPIRPQPAEAAVRETVTAFLKHRPLHIPGRLMRIMTRLTPRSLSVRMNGRMLGHAARNLAQRQAATAGWPASPQVPPPDRSQGLPATRGSQLLQTRPVRLRRQHLPRPCRLEPDGDCHRRGDPHRPSPDRATR